MENQNRGSFKASWEFLTTITDPGHNEALGGPAARISVLPLQFSKYSFQVGWQQGGVFLPFFRPGVNLYALAGVVAKAQRSVAELAAESQLAETAARAAWEAKLAEAEAKKVAKKQRHEGNLQRRREEDRQRTQQAKNNGRK